MKLRITSWIHYGARYYSTKTGTFTQQDTLDAPLNPANANRYAFAGGDPVNNTDPTGKWSPFEDVANIRSWEDAKDVVVARSISSVLSAKLSSTCILAVTGGSGGSLAVPGVAACSAAGFAMNSLLAREIEEEMGYEY